MFDFVQIELISQMYSLFRILDRLYGEIPLDKVLRSSPGGEEGHCQTDRYRPEGVANSRVWIETKRENKQQQTVHCQQTNSYHFG